MLGRFLTCLRSVSLWPKGDDDTDGDNSGHEMVILMLVMITMTMDFHSYDDDNVNGRNDKPVHILSPLCQHG